MWRWQDHPQQTFSIAFSQSTGNFDQDKKGISLLEQGGQMSMELWLG